MVPTFELIGSRSTKAAMLKQSGFQFLADQGSHFAVVTGPMVGKAALPAALTPDGALEERKQLKVTLSRNGEVLAPPSPAFGSAVANVGLRPGSDSDAGPFWSLFWLANHLASGSHGGTLETGDVIIP